MTSSLNLWRRAERLKLAAVDSPKNASEAWINRQSLQEIYQNLLINDLEFSLDKKAEQDLWNFAFKKQIVTLQNQCKDKQNQRRGEVQAGLNLFLDAASGFYFQLIQELCVIFGLDLSFRRKCKKLGITKECLALFPKSPTQGKSSCLYLCQDCLVHLGDIARYRMNYDQAEVFYKHAALLVPTNGQPYNQLAILEAQKGNKLSTIFYHTRSLAVQYPFPVAEINCNKFYARLSKDGQDSRQKFATNEWLSMFLQFLASVHLELDPMKSRIRLDRIVLSFKPNLTSLGFNSQQLIQMVAILFYEYHSIVEKKKKNDGVAKHNLINSDVNDLLHRRKCGDKTFTTMGDDDDDDEEVDEFREHDGKIYKKEGILPGAFLSGKELEEVYKKRISMVLELAETMMESLLMTANEKEELHELLLPVVKVMLDWLISNEDVVLKKFILNSGLWSNLCSLANNLILELVKLGHYEKFTEAFKSMPLHEDGELQCFLPLKLSHMHLSFTWKNLEKLSKIEEKTLRMCRILNSCKKLEKLSTGILKAEYSSDSKKSLISFETSIQKSKPDVFNTNNITITDKRLSRFNVAIQTILQSNDKHFGEALTGDGDNALKQTKKLLKVEFKEAVEDIWRERDSKTNQIAIEDKSVKAQTVNQNKNNSPHSSLNVCTRPYKSRLNVYPSVCYGFAYRTPMYPLPPPPTLPFFRTDCPLPAPSAMPRFNPLTSYGMSMISSDLIVRDESALKIIENTKGNNNSTSCIELNCIPSGKNGALNTISQVNTLSTAPNLISKLLSRGLSNEDQRNLSCSHLPDFQHIHPFPQPMSTFMYKSGDTNYPILPTLGDTVPRFCQNLGEHNSQPRIFLGNESNTSDRLCDPYNDFRHTMEKDQENLLRISTKPFEGILESRYHTRDFNQKDQNIQSASLAGRSICSTQHVSSSSVNSYGTRVDKNVLAQSSCELQFDSMSSRSHDPSMLKQTFNYSHSDFESQKSTTFQSYSDFSQETNNRSDIMFGDVLPPQVSSADWWNNTLSSNTNESDILQSFDIHLCDQGKFNRISRVMKYPNSNNSSSKRKPGESAVSSTYNIFNKSPWSPDLVSDKDVLNARSSKKSGSLVDNSLDAGVVAFWSDFPAVANTIVEGQVSMAESTSNVMLSGNNFQHVITTSTSWSCQPTPLEKLIQMQKQLKPSGS